MANLWMADYELETDMEFEPATVDVGYANQFVGRVRRYLQQEDWL